MTTTTITFPTIADGLKDLTEGAAGTNPSLDALMQQTYYSGAQHVLATLHRINSAVHTKAITPEQGIEEMNKMTREVNAVFSALLKEEPAAKEPGRIVLIN